MHRGSDHRPLGRENLVVVQSHVMWLDNFFTGHNGLDFLVDIDTNPSSMGQIFGV